MESDPDLDDVTHVIVDEVHERTQDSDFLLMLLRDLLPKRPDLRIVLMSATVNADLFASYFESASTAVRSKGGVPIVEIPGKTFPVNQVFLEDVIDLTGYALDDNSEYARPPPPRHASGRAANDNRSLATIYKGLGEYSDMVDEADLKVGRPVKIYFA